MPDNVVTATLADGTVVDVVVAATDTDDLASVSLSDHLVSLDRVMDQVAALASTVRDHLQDVAPTRATVEFGIGLSIKAGKLTALLVNGETDMSMKLTLEW